MTVPALFECIHGLDQGTCSFCSGRDAREAKSRETLSAMLRRALEKYPNQDPREVARIVVDHVLTLPNASDLLIPAVVALMDGIERAPVRRLELAAVKSSERSQRQPEALRQVRPSDATLPAGAIPPPEGMTLSEFAREQAALDKANGDRWRRDFVLRSVMKKTVRINGVRVKWEDVTREQALDRLKELDKKRVGLSASMTFVERYLRLLDETGCETAGEYVRMMAAEVKPLHPLQPAKGA